MEIQRTRDPLTSPASEREALHTVRKSDKTSRAHSTLLFQQRWGKWDFFFLALFILPVVAMAWYYTPHITSEVPGEWWDPLLNIWTLAWDAKAPFHDPAHFWQGQLLYPNTLTLSYSENLLGESIFFTPLFWLTHNPVLSYNLVFYLLFFLCGVTMYMLARAYTGSCLAAFIAGLLYAFAPYRIGQIDHLHIIAGMWLPLAFLYFDRAMADNRWRHWSLFALFYILQVLSSIYYGIFLTYALIAYTLIRYTIPFITHLRHERWTYVRFLLRSALRPLIVWAAAGLFLGTLMTPYLLSLGKGIGRSLDQTAVFSAYIRDFLFTAPFNLLYGQNTYNGELLPYDNEHYLFPGLVILLLAIGGITLIIRHRHKALRAYLWTGLVILLFSFGPFLQYSTTTGAPLVLKPGTAAFASPPGWPMPWFLAWNFLPGFRGLRAPARLVGVLLLILALAAAYMVAHIQKQVKVYTTQNTARLHLQRKTKKWQVLLLNTALLLLPLLVLLEGLPAYLPVTFVPTGTQIPPVYQWLATHDSTAPIVELPMAYHDQGFTSQQEAWYDYYAVYHNHPLENGWSGFRSPLTVDISKHMLDFPAPDSIAILRRDHVRYVVLHQQLYPEGQGAALVQQASASNDLQLIVNFGDDTLWQVRE